MTVLTIVPAYAETYVIRNLSIPVPTVARPVQNSTVKPYAPSTFLHTALCWTNRLMSAPIAQVRKTAGKTMPITRLIGHMRNILNN